MERLNENEIAELRKMNRRAHFIKGSIVGMILAYCMLICSIFFDIVCYMRNVSRDTTMINMIVGAIGTITLTVVWLLTYGTYSAKVEKDALWLSILNKYSGDIEVQVDSFDTGLTEVTYSVTLANTLIQESSKLQQTGHSLYNLVGRARMKIVLYTCTDVCQFSENVALANNIQLKKHTLIKIFCYLPFALMVFFGIFVNSFNMSSVSIQRDEIEQKLLSISGMSTINVDNERITYLDSESNSYEIKLSGKNEVIGFRLGYHCGKTTPKEEVVANVNSAVSNLVSMIKYIGLEYEEDFLDTRYGLSKEFLGQFRNMNLNDSEGDESIFVKTDIGGRYKLECNAYIRTDDYVKPDSNLVIWVQLIRY